MQWIWWNQNSKRLKCSNVSFLIETANEKQLNVSIFFFIWCHRIHWFVVIHFHCVTHFSLFLSLSGANPIVLALRFCLHKRRTFYLSILSYRFTQNMSREQLPNAALSQRSSKIEKKQEKTELEHRTKNCCSFLLFDSFDCQWTCYVTTFGSLKMQVAEAEIKREEQQTLIESIKRISFGANWRPIFLRFSRLHAVTFATIFYYLRLKHYNELNKK